MVCSKSVKDSSEHTIYRSLSFWQATCNSKRTNRFSFVTILQTPSL